MSNLTLPQHRRLASLPTLLHYHKLIVWHVRSSPFTFVIYNFPPVITMIYSRVFSHNTFVFFPSSPRQKNLIKQNYRYSQNFQIFEAFKSEIVDASQSVVVQLPKNTKHIDLDFIFDGRKEHSQIFNRRYSSESLLPDNTYEIMAQIAKR